MPKKRTALWYTGPAGQRKFRKRGLGGAFGGGTGWVFGHTEGKPGKAAGTGRNPKVTKRKGR